MGENLEWKEIQPNIWKPEQEDSIQGVLVSKEESKGAFGSTAYAIENKEGQFIIWGTAVLDERMKYIEVGDQVKIEYKGTTKNQKGQLVKIYKVYKGTKE